MRDWLAFCLIVLVVAPGAAVASSGEDSNAAAAAADAPALLAALSLPDGSTALEGEPADDAGRLSTAGFVTAGPNVATVTSWWRSSQDVDAVMAWVNAHRPAGTQVAVSGGGGGPGVAPGKFVAFRWPDVFNVLTWRTLSVAAVPGSDGTTVVRADGSAGWLIPRPASEDIPSGATLLTITATHPLRGEEPAVPLRHAIRTRNLLTINGLAALLNRVPLFQPSDSFRSCLPTRVDPKTGKRSVLRVRLAWRVTAKARPFATALIDGTVCGSGARLWVDGVPQPPLELTSVAGYDFLDALRARLAQV